MYNFFLVSVRISIETGFSADCFSLFLLFACWYISIADLLLYSNINCELTNEWCYIKNDITSARTHNKSQFMCTMFFNRASIETRTIITVCWLLAWELTESCMNITNISYVLFWWDEARAGKKTNMTETE